ncbi:glycosyltransferase family 61 protein [Tritonibacter mobilis]|uniref:glycosyltransferase 61 family protein n=1 Tax=Tritonibacter mobilis TaxID=379347 RepID=UPI000E0D9565|nr:glycosyltransferase 61 family protein [Tritonibacter mobilis]
MTDIRRSITKRLMERTQETTIAARFAKNAINAVGYAIFDIKNLDLQAVQRLPAVYPGSKSEVARPVPLGGSKELHVTDLPPVEPLVFNNLQAQSGSSVFRHHRSAFVGSEIYEHLDRVRMDSEFETCIVKGDRVALKRSEVAKIDRGICAFGQGSSNWYHWVAECLPTVLLSQNLPSAYDDYPLLVPEAALTVPSFKDTLDICRGGRNVVPMKEAQLYEIAELVYIPPQVSGPFNVSAGSWPEPKDYTQNIDLMQQLRNTILNALDIRRTDDGPKKVFLARPPGTR